MNNSIFGLPETIIFCKKCVESNQRFMGSTQLDIRKNEKKLGVGFDDKGVCLSCRYFEKKDQVNWDEREKELQDILSRHRKQDGSYDVLIPGSGGKDTQYLSYILNKSLTKRAASSPPEPARNSKNTDFLSFLSLGRRATLNSFSKSPKYIFSCVTSFEAISLNSGSIARSEASDNSMLVFLNFSINSQMGFSSAYSFDSATSSLC